MRNANKEEWVTSYADLVAWLEFAGAVARKQAAALRAAGERSPDAARGVWARAIKLREAVAAVFLAKTEHRAPVDQDLRLIEKEYARTAPCARLSPTGEGFQWTLDADSELDAALRPILESAVALMTSERMRRLRRCGNSTCYWLFLDETKNRSPKISGKHLRVRPKSASSPPQCGRLRRPRAGAQSLSSITARPGVN